MKQKQALGLGLFTIIVVIGGIWLTSVGGLRWASVMLAIIGITSFFMFIAFAQASESTEEVMRRAIAASLTVVYIALLSTVAFWREAPDMPEITTKMVESFTYVIGVIIAFYFGASAYAEGQKSGK